MSYLFTFLYCSWGSWGKNTGVVCHSLLQWTMFCHNFGIYLVSYSPLSLVVFFWLFFLFFHLEQIPMSSYFILLSLSLWISVSHLPIQSWRYALVWECTCAVCMCPVALLGRLHLTWAWCRVFSQVLAALTMVGGGTRDTGLRVRARCDLGFSCA